jgi:hypothetical protein
LFLQKNDVINEPQAESVESDPMTFKPSEQDVTVLGERKNNPYTVANMKKAFASLSSRARISEEANTVRITHLYVRFLPSDWAQYDELKRDTSLTLYNIPLDYEVEKQGSNYHDPSIAADKPTWQYTSVPVGFKFNPNIKHEIISECYIPEYDNQLAQLSSNARISSSGKTLTDQLIDEAMIVSGNPNDTLKFKSNAQRVAWHPSGRVSCFDTRLNQMIGLQGVKIIVRRWIIAKVREERTDYYGDYYFEDFNRPVSYSCVFETDKFDVRSGTWGQVQFDGPKSTSSWNLQFWANDLNLFYCSVFRGAYRYHYGEMGGLRRPYIDAKIKYACHTGDGEVNGDFWGLWDPTGLTPDIRIYEFSNGNRRTSDQAFSTAIHETAHASHAKLNREKNILRSLALVDNVIVESWAVAVQWYITKMEYKERGISNYGELDYRTPINNSMPERLESNYQWWTYSEKTNKYTSLFIDLVDNYNQNGQLIFNTINANAVWAGSLTNIDDKITGYTLPFIEQNILWKVKGISTWPTYSSLNQLLKDNKQNSLATDNQIDTFLNQYIN